MSKQYDTYPESGDGGTAAGCVTGGGLCTMCSSAGVCSLRQNQSKPFGLPQQNKMHRICPTYKKPCFNAQCEHVCFLDDKYDEPEERGERKSIHCPGTGQHCHDPLCRKDFCLRKSHKDKKDSEKTWEKLMQEFDRQPYHFGVDKDKIIANLAASIDRLTRNTEPPRKPIFVLSTIINNQKFIYMADIKLTLGVTSKGPGIFTLIDNVTGAVLTGVTFSNQQIGANSNPAAATFAFSTPDNNSVDGTPLAAGSGTIAFATQATYADSLGVTQTNVPFTLVKNFTVALGADNVSFDVTFP